MFELNWKPDLPQNLLACTCIVSLVCSRMTKRVDVIKKIRTAAEAADMTFEVRREGARHTVYSLSGLMIPIPRHREIDNQMAETIYKEAIEKLGEDWWK